MSERSREAQRAILDQIADHEAVKEHAEYDAAIATVCSLFDVDSFQRAWAIMSVEDQDEVTTLIADGIEERLRVRSNEILIKIAESV